VTTPNASARIDNRVKAAGGRIERVRLGALHEGIAATHRAGDKETKVAFAAEPWKHIHTRFGPWIDGVLSTAVVARLVAESGLAELRDPVNERPYRKVSISCPDGAKRNVMATLNQQLPEQFDNAQVETEHGIRLSFNDASWLLVRPSGTEPYVRLYAESDAVDRLVESAATVVRDTVDNI
jgi:phosphomannomutase